MPRKTDSNKPADWIWICERDMEGVRALSVQEISHAMCRSKLAEVLEKIMKAELIRQGWVLVKTHDLKHLSGELISRDPELGEQAADLCDELDKDYLIDRYPGFDMRDEDWPAARELVQLVDLLLAKVKQRIEAVG